MKKRFLAMLLAVIMVMSLAGCSRGDTGKLVGKWYCEIGAEEAVLEEVPEEFADMVEYLSFDKVYLPVCFEFKADSAVCVYVDEQEFAEVVDNFAEAFIDGIVRYMMDLVYEETGTKVTEDEIWEYIGFGEQEFRDELAAEIIEGMKEISDLSMEGKYKAEDGRLYLSEDLDSEFDPEKYLAYSLEDDELRIIGAVGKGEFPVSFPLVFEKVG